MKWFGGLITAWLLLSWPVATPGLKASVACQTAVSCLSPWEESGESGYSATAAIHTRVALVSPLPSFSFGPSTEFLPCIRWVFHTGRYTEVSDALRESFSVFRFLRLIFEHQIAINAP